MGLWVKGQSGNPRGRPSHARIAAALKEHEKAAIDCLARLVAHSRKDSVSLAAAQTILAYIHGKPVDGTPSSPASSTLLTWTPDQLAAAESQLEPTGSEGEANPAADPATDSDAGVGNGAP